MTEDVRALAQEHLVPHFTRRATWTSPDLPVFVRGEGCYLFDDRGRRFLDGLSGLFCVNLGHGRADLAAVAAAQMETLAYASNWSVAHPAAAEAARLIAELAPGDLDRVFFVNSGSEAVESAIKLARQYHRSRGEEGRTKIIARHLAYHGTTMGALSVTGIPWYRTPFEPLLPGVFHAPNTRRSSLAEDQPVADLECVRAIEDLIEREGAGTIAALFAEPVQNGGGALVPPPGYWAELRSLCDRTGILLVADEVITGFGRLGEWFGIERERVVPDLVTFAKGATSAYVPMGGVVVRRPVAEAVFAGDAGSFAHGSTFGGHPVATAVAAANITALGAEGILDNVRRLGPYLGAGLAELVGRHPTLREVRGTGFLYALELVADNDRGTELTDEQALAVLRQVLPSAMAEVGLVTRADDRGATMLILAPPLVADRAVLDELLEQTDAVIGAVDRFVARAGVPTAAPRVSSS